MTIPKNNWKIIKTSSEQDKHTALMSIDENKQTWWHSRTSGNGHYITIDLGASYSLKAFAYTPQQVHAQGMMAKGVVEVSEDGRTWATADSFEFGNLINDPSTRKHIFSQVVTARYVRITATEIAGGDNTLAIAELDFFER